MYIVDTYPPEDGLVPLKYITFANEKVERALKEPPNNEEYIGNNFDLLNNYRVKFKKDGFYILTSWYALTKWDNTTGNSLRDTVNIRADKYFFNYSLMRFLFNKSGRLSNNDVASGCYPYIGITLKYIKVESGVITVLPYQDVKFDVDYSTLKIEYNNYEGTVNFLEYQDKIKIKVSLSNKVYIKDWLSIGFNEYRSLQSEIETLYTIENNIYTDTTSRQIDYYDGWFSYDDYLYINLLQIQVTKITGVDI